MSNPGGSGADDKYDMRGLSFASHSYEKDLPLWTENVLFCILGMLPSCFLIIKRKQDENRSVQLFNPCPFSGLSCLCCWCTNGCTGFFFCFKSHFLVCFAMPATLIADILPQSFKLTVDVTLQWLYILSACGSLNSWFTKWNPTETGSSVHGCLH